MVTSKSTDTDCAKIGNHGTHSTALSEFDDHIYYQYKYFSLTLSALHFRSKTVIPFERIDKNECFFCYEADTKKNLRSHNDTILTPIVTER